MKVNRSSWRYKLMKYFKFDIISDLHCGSKVTLCRYFWNVLGGLLHLLGAVALSIATVVIGLCILVTLLSPISYLTQSYFGFGWDFATELGVIMIWMFWVAMPLVGGFTAVFEGQMKVFPSWMKIKLLPPAASSKPNILVEYVKAKKNKFCPLIELDKE